MGGRLDATNVVEPRISVITDISLDHQKFLGNTVAEIAAEKAGIIRPGGVVVTLPQQPQANDVIGRSHFGRRSPGVSAVPYVPPVSPASAQYLGRTGDAGIRYPLQVMGKEILIETPLIGRHQLRNMALAIATAEELARQGFPVTAASIEQVSANRIGQGVSRFYIRKRLRTMSRSTFSMWRIIRPGHGRCVRLCRRVMRIGRSHLFSERCETRRLAKWRRFSFRWRNG